MASQSIEQNLYEEATRLKRMPFMLFPSLMLLLLSFIIWPSSYPFTPLDRFVVGHFSLWSLMALFFGLGLLVEVVPVFYSNHFHLTRFTPLLFQGEKGSFHYYLVKGAYVFIEVLPLLVWGIWTLFFKDPLTSLLLFLARKKGYQEGFYHGDTSSSVLFCFLSGTLTMLVLGTYLFYPKFKQHIQEKLGKSISELAHPEKSWKQRLKSSIGWIIFGAIIPLYSLGGVGFLLLLFFVGGMPSGMLFVLLSFIPSIVLAIASPLAWIFYTDKSYTRAANVVFITAGSFIISILLVPFVFFFPPRISDFMTVSIPLAIQVSLFLVIGFWLRSKEEEG